MAVWGIESRYVLHASLYIEIQGFFFLGYRLPLLIRNGQIYAHVKMSIPVHCVLIPPSIPNIDELTSRQGTDPYGHPLVFWEYRRGRRKRCKSHQCIFSSSSSSSSSNKPCTLPSSFQ